MSDIEVLRTGYLSEADFAASALKEAGIPFYRRNGTSSGLSIGMGSAGIGPIDEHFILVPEEAAEEARELLAELLGVDDQLENGPDTSYGTQRPKDKYVRILVIIILSLLVVPVLAMAILNMVACFL